MLLLLPRDPLASRRVDERFAAEAAAAAEPGAPDGVPADPDVALAVAR